MNYTEEFKRECFNTLKYQPYIREIMSALDNNKHTLIRYYLEDSLDDEDLYEQEIITDEGERIVKNSKINAYNKRSKLYSIFMDNYVKSIDGELINA